LHHKTRVRDRGIGKQYDYLQLNQNLANEAGESGMTHQQAIEYFFDRIRGQILTALANRKMCEDLHLIEKLALFERDRREAVGEESYTIKS